MLAIEIKTTKLTAFLVKQLPPATDEDLDAFLDSGDHGVHVRLGVEGRDLVGVFQGAGRLVRSHMIGLAPEMKERCTTQVFLES